MAVSTTAARVVRAYVSRSSTPRAVLSSSALSTTASKDGHERRGYASRQRLARLDGQPRRSLLPRPSTAWNLPVNVEGKDVSACCCKIGARRAIRTPDLDIRSHLTPLEGSMTYVECASLGVHRGCIERRNRTWEHGVASLNLLAARGSYGRSPLAPVATA